jgi:hypothetical protein
MMTDEQKAKITELKAAIATTATAPGGAPEAVRKDVVELKKELRRTGTTARELATALGLHETTLCRWEREVPTGRGPSTRGMRRASRAAETSERAAGFRRVQITAPSAPATHSVAAPVAASTPRGLRVAHAPSGLVVDGLDVETLAALLRRLS